MAKRRGGESKQGLVITLVFFILATIGLGVATYYGFAEQENLTKAAKEAKDKEATANKERDWYKYQALAYRAYMGKLPNAKDQEFLVSVKRQAAGAQGSEADRAEVTALMKELDDKTGWQSDPQGKLLTNLPKASLVDVENGLKTRIGQLQAEVVKEREQRGRAEAAEKSLKDEVEALKATHTEELAKLNKRAKDDRGGDEAKIAALTADLKTNSEHYVSDLKKLEAERKRLQDEVARKDEEIRNQRAVIARSDAKVARAERKVSDAPTDHRIVLMDRTGQLPYINVGSADGAKPQLTFSIHAIGPDGRPQEQSKGSLEIVKVVEAHLSQARITETKDANRDPILKGDVLFNPTWDPTLRKRVAVVGIIDLTGDGRDNSVEFIRQLERQGVVVDAYLDIKDNMTIKGKGMTVQTDYLIVGEGLEFGEGRERDAEFRKKIEQKINEMQKEAVRNGVEIIPFRKYMEQSGFRVPKGLADTSGYRPPSVLTQPAAPPPPGGGKEEKPPMKPEDKKPEDKK
jgi:hypothetical protein